MTSFLDHSRTFVSQILFPDVVAQRSASNMGNPGKLSDAGSTVSESTDLTRHSLHYTYEICVVDCKRVTARWNVLEANLSRHPSKSWRPQFGSGIIYTSCRHCCKKTKCFKVQYAS
jgi:hypothetical protein